MPKCRPQDFSEYNERFMKPRQGDRAAPDPDSFTTVDLRQVV